MRKVVLYIAMSLDGYIADKAGKMNWLDGENDDAGSEDSYSEFVKTLDTVVMDQTTYHRVVTELSPSEWVYEKLTSYVITHRSKPSTEKIRFVQESPNQLIRRLKETEGKDIRVCGGVGQGNKTAIGGLQKRRRDCGTHL